MRRSRSGRHRIPCARVRARGWESVLAAALLACGGGGGEAPVASETAAEVNAQPVVVSVRLEPPVPLPGNAVRAVVVASDPDRDPVKMTYAWTLRGQPVGGGLSKLVLRDASKGDRLAVSVVASDGRAESEPVVASVELGNHPPRIERLLILPEREVSAGTEFEARPRASDPDGDEIRFEYVWSVDERVVDADGPTFSTAGIGREQVVRVEVRASDGSDTSEALDSGPLRVVNWPPKVTSRPGPSLPGGGFRYQVLAEDPDGNTPLLFELDAAPRGMQIDATTGEIEWTPARAQAGVHRVRVIVDDQHGGRVSHAFDVEVGGMAGSPAAASER